MRKKGSALIAMGLLLIAAALLLTGYNIWDADRADKAAQSTVAVLRELIPGQSSAVALPESASSPPTTAAISQTGSVQATETTEVPDAIPANSPAAALNEDPVLSEPGEASATAKLEKPAVLAVSGDTPADAEPIKAPYIIEPIDSVVPIEPAADEVPNESKQPVAAEIPAEKAPKLKMEKPLLLAEPQHREMPTVTINGFRYIGMIEVESLDLSLPVMEEWDYDRLRVSPCRFSGNVYENDLVICAHNYAQHFTPLKYVPMGTVVKFIDAEGTEFYYEVASMENMGPNEAERMTSGDWDLTLFTCNTDGQSRRAVRCIRIN